MSSEEDTWLELIKATHTRSRLLFLSFSCEEKAQKGIIMVKEAFDTNIESIFDAVSDFDSLVLHRLGNWRYVLL